MFRVKHSVAKGIAIGTAAHVVGTAKAFELGQTEGAFASISIVTTRLAAVIFMPLVSADAFGVISSPWEK